jgi:7-cyano-7-deazaguanine synthase
MTADERGALVLFSGGQDSTACLAWALQRYTRVHTVGFDYGQRHAVELQARQAVRAQIQTHYPDWAERLGPDHLLDATVIGQVGESALTDSRALALRADGLPNTFVPGRNLLFFTLAAALAYRLELGVLVGGMCETDYSGYPDCKDNTIKALQVALSLGLATPLTIETPLMWLDKAQTWAWCETLGGQQLNDIIIEHSHTCYLGERTHRHAWGCGCGECSACMLRARGFQAWQAQSQPTLAVNRW